MTTISNKKRKFVKRNFRQLSLEDLARKTGLKPNVVRSLIEEYSAEMPNKDHSAHTKNRVGFSCSWKTILLASLILAVSAFIIYSPSLRGTFVFDDVRSIQDNALIHIKNISQLTDLIFSQEVGRKVGYLSFAINYYCGELDTFGYHLVNVIIHILNGLVLFLLSYTILTLPLHEARWRKDALKIAFLGSLIWLVHPIQSQAVSYIVQRLTSLSTLFFLLSLFCYIKGRMSQSFKQFILFVLCIFLGLLALGTKQNAATLPFFIILSEFFFLQRFPLTMDRKKLIFLILTVGIFIVIAWTYLGSDIITKLAQQYEKRGWTPLERLLTQLRVVMFYLSLLIYPNPSRLNLDHDFSLSHSLFSPYTTFSSLLVIISLLVLAIFFIKRNRLVSYALFWFLGNLVIESSIIPLELVFEHRLYLPSMGLMVVVSGLWVSVPKGAWHKWAPALIIPPVLLFSYWTYERTHVWQDPVSLWEDAAQKSPNKARPHSNLCRIYGMKNRLNEAISECEEALAIHPNFAKARNNLGAAFQKKGLRDKAIAEFKKAIDIDPDYARAYYNLAVVHGENEHWDKAIIEYTHAIALKPDYADAHNNIAVAYSVEGNYTLAILHCDKAMALGYKVNPRLNQFLKPYR